MAQKDKGDQFPSITSKDDAALDAYIEGPGEITMDEYEAATKERSKRSQ